jgi:hypothetical protein
MLTTVEQAQECSLSSNLVWIRDTKGTNRNVEYARYGYH